MALGGEINKINTQSDVPAVGGLSLCAQGRKGPQ